MPMIRLKRFHGVAQVCVVAFNQACMSEIRVTGTYWPDTGEEEPHAIHAELIAMMQDPRTQRNSPFFSIFSAFANPEPLSKHVAW